MSTAKNSYTKTHTMQAMYATKVGLKEKIFLHAEIAAIIKCNGIPYKIRIERKNARGKLMLAAPCPICQLAIKEANIKFIEYSI